MTFEAGLDYHPLQPLPLYYIDTPTGVRRGRQAVDGNGFNQRLDFWLWFRYICQMKLYRGSLSSQHMEKQQLPKGRRTIVDIVCQWCSQPHDVGCLCGDIAKEEELPYRKNTISRKRYFVGTHEECDSLHIWLMNVLKYPAESITCYGIDDNTSALGFNSPFMTERGFRKTLEAV